MYRILIHAAMILIITTSFYLTKVFPFGCTIVLSVICFLTDLCIIWLPYVQIIILTMTIKFSSVICIALTLPAVPPNLHSFVVNLHTLSLATLYCLLCNMLLHFFSLMMFTHAAVVNKSPPIP